MIRKLFTIAFLLGSINAFSQDSKPDAPKPQPNINPADISAFDFTDPGDPLPDFLLKTLDGKLYTQNDFKNEANLFVMLFNPSCSHCQDQTKMLEKNIALFKKSKIVLVAKPVMSSYLPTFIKDMNTDSFPTITVGIDSLHLIHDVSLEQQLPQMNIYDKSRKLIKIYEGEMPIDSFKHYIQ